MDNHELQSSRWDELCVRPPHPQLKLRAIVKRAAGARPRRHSFRYQPPPGVHAPHVGGYAFSRLFHSPCLTGQTGVAMTKSTCGCWRWRRGSALVAGRKCRESLKRRTLPSTKGSEHAAAQWMQNALVCGKSRDYERNYLYCEPGRPGGTGLMSPLAALGTHSIQNWRVRVCRTWRPATRQNLAGFAPPRSPRPWRRGRCHKVARTRSGSARLSWA